MVYRTFWSQLIMNGIILNLVEILKGNFGSKVVDDFFSSLGVDKTEWVVDIEKGKCSLKGFLSVVGDSIGELKSREFKEGLDDR